MLRTRIPAFHKQTPRALGINVYRAGRVEAAKMEDIEDYDDWRRDCETVPESLGQIRKRALFADVRFLVGCDVSARYFSAHKMILACGSPVFEAMFYGQLAEKKDPVPMPDDDPEGFETMLRHLYGESLDFPSIVVACKTYCIADKYLMPHLKKKCINFISTTQMNDANCWGMIESNLFPCKIAEEKFRNYIKVHASRFLKSDEFLDLPESIIKMILLMDELEIKEFELLCFLTKWGFKTFTKDTIWKLQSLLTYIRFSTLTPQEFCQFHEEFPNIIDHVNSLKILKHLNDPEVYNLPYWCSINKSKRDGKAEPMLVSGNSGLGFSANNSMANPAKLLEWN